MNSESKIKRILIAGGSGLIGRQLIQSLCNNAEVRILSRKMRKVEGASVYYWNPEQNEIDPESLYNVDVIINLAGENIGQSRWTKSRKEALLNSRILPIQCLVKALDKLQLRPDLIIQASAIGIYGSRKGELLTEESSLKGGDYVTELNTKWEVESKALLPFCDRLVIIRTGLVLSAVGGIWPELMMTSPFRILTWFGRGEQVFSWIHLEDVGEAVRYLIEKNDISGVVNLSAPGSLTQRELMHTIGRVLDKYYLYLGIPEFLLRIIIGKRTTLLLEDQKVYPEKLLRHGFEFKYNNAEDAIKAITGSIQ
ncbi:MAG: TIGR01777 family oxidoreductase [Saprospiraceae bacterium]